MISKAQKQHTLCLPGLQQNRAREIMPDCQKLLGFKELYLLCCETVQELKLFSTRQYRISKQDCEAGYQTIRLLYICCNKVVLLFFVRC